MNRTTFRDLWVGGVSVKTVLLRVVDLLFLKKNTAHHADQYFYLEINWITIIGTNFKHNSCESADGRSKHSIYRDVIEMYARI